MSVIILSINFDKNVWYYVAHEIYDEDPLLLAFNSNQCNYESERKA